MKWTKEEWERLIPEGPGELNIPQTFLDFFDEQQLFQELPELMEEDLTAIMDDDLDQDLDLDLHADHHDDWCAVKELQDQAVLTLIMVPWPRVQNWHQQNPGPLNVPPVLHVVPDFAPPAHAGPAMTHHGCPVDAAGWNTAPTVGGQTCRNHCGFQPVALIQTAFPVRAPVSHSFRKKEEVADGSYIKKTPNAFMRFLKENRKSAEEELGQRSCAVVNKHLGQRWKSLSPEDKERYRLEAKAEALIHLASNEGWSYRNNYGKKRKRRLSVGTYPPLEKPKTELII